MAILDHQLTVARTGTTPTPAKDLIFIYKGGRAPEHVTHVRIDKSIDKIDDGAFEYCISLESIETHNKIRRVGKYAFHRCHSLKGIKLPGVTEVDEGAFWGCTSLSELEFGVGLQRIGEGAFSHCTLKRLVIPSRVSIEKCAFIDCAELTDVELSGGFDSIERGAFYGCRSPLRLKISGITVINEEFIGSSGISDVEFSEELELVRANAFSRCASLKTMVMPKVTVIEKYAFSDCTSLKSMKMPSVLTIGAYAFNKCEELTDLEVPVDFELMEKYAFHKCHSLRRIAIPLKDGVISDNAFTECEELARVDLVGDVHNTISTFGLESSRDEMKKEMNQINQDLLQIKRDRESARIDNKDVADITKSIQRWIKTTLEKYTKLEALHSKQLKEAVKSAQKQWSSLFSGLTTDNDEFITAKGKVMLQIRATVVSTAADAPHELSKKDIRKKKTEEENAKKAAAKQQDMMGGGFLSRLAAGVPSLEKKDLR